MFHIRKLYIPLICVLLSLCLLSGCAGTGDPDPDGPQNPGANTPVPGNPPETENPRPPVQHEEGYTPADSVFSASWDPEGSMNPLFSDNTKNTALFTLIYEGLFRLRNDFTPEPVLCDSWETKDGVTFTFHLKSGVKFHDGGDLTAEDVVYTLTRAAQSDSRFSGRLVSVDSVRAVDDMTVRVKLKAANYRFPALLDLPVIRRDSAEAEVPAGTGPYVPRLSDDEPRLAAFSGHRDSASLPAASIYLKAESYSTIARAFGQRSVDILDRDFLSAVELNIHSDYETRYYDTTSFIYIGFNTVKGPMRDTALRRLIASVPNLDAICEKELRGFVRRAIVPISPAVSYYDTGWETEYPGSVGGDFTALAAAASLIDANNDGRWDTTRLLSSIDIRFVVNTENPYRLAAARAIAEELNFMGFDVTLTEFGYDEYLSALASGNFDMYLGEVKLTGDMDLGVILSSGGSLNFGSAKGYDSLLSALRSAPDEESRTKAARALCRYADGDMAILPIAYKRNAVITHPGIVSGLEPCPTGAFCDIAGWTIHLEEDAQ